VVASVLIKVRKAIMVSIILVFIIKNLEQCVDD
jgi:hypothetical protein